MGVTDDLQNSILIIRLKRSMRRQSPKQQKQHKSLFDFVFLKTIPVL